jgi:hypothetical protein
MGCLVYCKEFTSGLAQDDVVLCQRNLHRYGVPLPELDAAFDVGEEEGDGSGGEIYCHFDPVG